MKVWFWVMLLDVLNVPLSLVTVCGASLMLVHTTCVPVLIVSVAGSNMYILFFSMMFTLATVAVVLGAVVAVGLGVGCDVAVGVEAVVVPPPPHAAKSRAATSANEKNPHNNRARLASDERYICIR